MGRNKTQEIIGGEVKDELQRSCILVLDSGFMSFEKMRGMFCLMFDHIWEARHRYTDTDVQILSNVFTYRYNNWFELVGQFEERDKRAEFLSMMFVLPIYKKLWFWERWFIWLFATVQISSGLRQIS